MFCIFVFAFVFVVFGTHDICKHVNSSQFPGGGMWNTSVMPLDTKHKGSDLKKNRQRGGGRDDSVTGEKCQLSGYRRP
ncbi:hypothetical protein BD779DRAFT_196018 [Infundibulicybe gibba]|nr:hypothetical protein BD779DRAFT_196018 [Infundibulicybe gibba]